MENRENMITRYIIGTPIPTHAVTKEIEGIHNLPAGFELGIDRKSLCRKMNDLTVVYGLGETVRGINKRGWIYKSFCSDDPEHNEDKHSLYAAQNFIIVDDGDESTGFFVDTPGTIEFDIGYTSKNMLTVRFVDFDADIYVITGETNKDISRSFRELIGTSYIPPKWAFGYGQSRWSYADEDQVREVVDNYRKNNIPLDMVYLDIDYMDAYKDFTVSDERFPNFAEFVAEMREKGIRLVPIIDAGVKIEKGYDVYEEGLKGGYFCKKSDGTELVSAVWPGKTHFPDFLNPKVREWFGNKYKLLVDCGIEGFWNDMNEPAIFYTEDHLGEVFDEIDKYKGLNLDINKFFEFKDLVANLSNNPEDYRRFYHNYEGRTINHEKVHNLYGFNMTRAAGEAFEKICPDKRILMFSRASYIGMHRYGGVWTGDNKSRWSHLLLNIQQLPALNMCGFLYSGADTGGFGADCTEDLLMRWLAISMFTPLFRNHSAMGTRRQEAYAFGNCEAFRRLIGLRYSLIPYIYTEFMKAVRNNGLLFSPLSFEYPEDGRCREVEDQLMVGESIMIAPVYTQNSTGRYVYLPEEMKMIRFRSYDDYDEEILPAGDHYINVAINEVPVYIRPGHELPIGEAVETVEDIDCSKLQYIGFKCSNRYIIEE